MKFTSLFSIALCVALSYAQGIIIAQPVDGETLTVNEPFQVQLLQSLGPENVREVSVVIGLFPCPTNSCQGTVGPVTGELLFAGDFTPEIQEPSLPPFENFTFTVPSSTPPGNALLTVTHLFLIGLGLEPVLEFRNNTVTIQASS